jgi:hypothetical protein
MLIEELENRTLMTSLTLGMNVTNNPKEFNTNLTALRQAGMTTARIWYGPNNYKFVYNDAIKLAQKLHAKGYKILMVVSPERGQVGKTSQVTALFNKLMSIRNVVDYWEIGNEVDTKHYWKGSLKSYVTNFLAPASKVLHKFGEKVISAGVSWNPEDILTLRKNGMLRYVDFVGYHPYRNSVQQVLTDTLRARRIAGSKPLFATEWNVRGQAGTKWATMLKQVWPIINNNYYAAYYFNAIKIQTRAGVAGMILKNGKPNEPFYSAVKTFQRNVGGNVAKPSVTGFKIINPHTKKVIYTLNSSATITIKSLPTRNVDIEFLTSANAKSFEYVIKSKKVLHIQNTKPYIVIKNWSLYKGLKIVISTKAFLKVNAKGLASNEKTFTLLFR